MSERETQIQREATVDADEGLSDDDADMSLSDDVTGDVAETGDAGGVVQSLYDRTLGSVLSVRGLGIALVVTLASVVAFGLIPLLGTVGELLGVFVAGFVYGLVSGNSRYLELAVAGALAAGGSALLGNLLVSVFGTAIPVLVIAGTGLVVALAGHYFGRDMRAGLTRDIE